MIKKFGLKSFWIAICSRNKKCFVEKEMIALKLSLLIISLNLI